MGYSEEMFSLVADLAYVTEKKSNSHPLRDFDDIVFAVSLDSGLPVAEVRARLISKMPTLSNERNIS